MHRTPEPRDNKPAKDRWLPRLAALDRLSPGDFATLTRRQRLTSEPLTAAVLLDGLRQETAFKVVGGGKGIGFSADL